MIDEKLTENLRRPYPFIRFVTNILFACLFYITAIGHMPLSSSCNCNICTDATVTEGRKTKRGKSHVASCLCELAE